MAGVGLTPGRPMAAEDIRDFQPFPQHEAAGSSGRLDLQPVQWTLDLADCLGGDLAIQRRGVELRVPQQHLDHANIHLLFQKMGGEAVPQRMRGNALFNPRRVLGGMEGAVYVPVVVRFPFDEKRRRVNANAAWPIRNNASVTGSGTVAGD